MSLAGVCAAGELGSSGAADRMCCRELMFAIGFPGEGVWFGLGAAVVCDVYLIDGSARIAFRGAMALQFGGWMKGEEWEMGYDGRMVDYSESDDAPGWRQALRQNRLIPRREQCGGRLKFDWYRALVSTFANDLISRLWGEQGARAEGRICPSLILHEHSVTATTALQWEAGNALNGSGGGISW